MVPDRPFQVIESPPYPGNVITPPLKTLVAEYLFDLYDRERQVDDADMIDVHRFRAVLVDFLAWEEKRRTPPSVTRKGILDEMTASPAFYAESTKRP